jgi:predicted kinase
MPTVHLISGLPCSGKTTYAIALQQRVTDCVMFSLDRWLITAFGRYSLASVGQEEHTRRVFACRELIWQPASELLRRGVDVVLDDGFFLREHRARYVKLAADFGAQAKTHFIDTAIDVVRARLEARNAKLPQFNFSINPETLQGFLALFEPPSEDEGAEIVVVRRFSQAEAFER